MGRDCKLLHTIEIEDVITKIYTSKRAKKPIYISYNAIYSTPHYSIRSKVINDMKLMLFPFMASIKKISTPVSIVYEYSSKKTIFDLDNKVDIWAKVFHDCLKGAKIPDDNVKWIKKKTTEYIYREDPRDRLVIKIYKYK